MDMNEYWRTGYPVQAVQLSRENIREVAEAVGRPCVEIKKTNVGLGSEDLPKSVLVIEYNGQRVEVGDWFIQVPKMNLFMKQENFRSKFQLASDRLANVTQLVMQVMDMQDIATRHEDFSGRGVIAASTAKKILGEV